jgi:hypothetical protein
MREPATAHQLELLLLEAGTAARAVTMQSQRATESSEHDELFDGRTWRSVVEFRFAAVALRWLEDIAETANRTLQDDALTSALQEFRAAVPQARNMRNIGEHLPEYILGNGRLQKKPDPQKRRGELRSLGSMTWTGYDGRGTHLTWADTNLDVEVARTAADRLFIAVRDAIRPGRPSKPVPHDGDT